ncbi:MAG TPA: hypothetical protein IAB56_04715 [Candidatus Scybalousia intestinigallinarum]|nr:hypothetical protein [Candidatus Scybalousia intestinigallinarum]
MIDKIDKIMTLDDGSKYMVMDQGYYDHVSYLYVSKLDQEGNLTDTFSIFEEKDDSVTIVKDNELLKKLAEFFKKRAEKEVE